MMNAKVTVERRKHERFEIWDEAFVLLGPDSTKLGRIIDIGMGGLAFSHVGRARPPSALFELDLFLVDSDYYLEKMPYEIISDIKTQNSRFDSIAMRRCGVRFGDLTHSQIAQLEYFIHSHTSGEVKV
jgi:hypothetical protein